MIRSFRAILAVALVMIVLVFAVWRYASSGRSDLTSLQTEVIEFTHHKQFTIEHETTGTIRAHNEHFLSVKYGGKLQVIYVRPGEEVSRGQVIAMVDETIRKSNLEQALSNFSLAQSEFNRVQQLFRAGVATAQERDESRTNLTVRRSELQSARQDLEDALIRSPVDGSLVLLAFRQGDYVPDGSRVAVVEERNQLKLVTKVPYQSRNLVGGKIIASIASFDMITRQPFGEWYEVDASLELMRENTIFDGASIDIVLSFLAESLPLPIGQSVMVRIPMKTFDDIYLISSEAVTEIYQQKAVVLQTPSNDFVVKPVELVDRFRNQLIVRGLETDMKVVNPMVLNKNPHIISQFKNEQNRF